MTSSKPRIKLLGRLDTIDLSKVVISEIEPYFKSFRGVLLNIKEKNVKVIIRNGQLGSVNAFLDGFEIPFTDLPKMVGVVNVITEAVVKYRLEKGI